ncbi:lytic transglycosylase domain-containing protein [bacterium]|nr:lytic transglycosylase domain-containing protein [bacterium]
MLSKILSISAFLLIFLVQDVSALGAKVPKPTPVPTPPPVEVPVPPAPQPEPEETVFEARWEPSNPNDGRDWTYHTYDEVEDLGPSLMTVKPVDVEAFCPGFSKLDDSGRKNFYTYLLSAMSKFESNYNPSVKYQEAFNDRFGNPVISRGLLQLSKESANGYGCNIGNEQELHDPYVNLSCAIRILDRWVGRDGRIAGNVSGGWKGGARYWSVLRKESTLGSIQAWTKAFCVNNF